METKTHSGPIYFICFCNGFVHFSDSLCSIHLRQWCESRHLSLYIVPFCIVPRSCPFLFPPRSITSFIYLFVEIRLFVCLFVFCFFIPFHFDFQSKHTDPTALACIIAPSHPCLYLVRTAVTIHTHSIPFRFVEVCRRKRKQ